MKKQTNITIKPARLSGRVAAIPSKSYAQRILVAAALSDQPTEILLDCRSLANDIRATLAALESMGASITVKADRIIVRPVRLPSTQEHFISCGESGTTARLLLPILCTLFDQGTLTGEGSLLARPFAALCQALEAGGVNFDNCNLPISWEGYLQATDFQLPGDESSQYVSGLLYALPLLPADSTIALTSPLQSAGYVDITLDVLRQFDITIECPEPNHYHIPGNQRYVSPETTVVEGDWSNSAFWLAAGVEVTGLESQSLQRDKVFAAVKDQPEIDVSNIPDLVPILSICAALRTGTTRIYNIKRLRRKESDRIATIRAMLHALGCSAQASDDALLIHGTGEIRGGIVDGANDHRIVMAAAIAASSAQDAVTITGADAVAKTYPHFFEDYRRLGGHIAVK